jgi:hypothetical protein
MPWIARTPSQDRIDFWRGLSQGGHKVAKWPHSNTVRIDPRFRVSRTHFSVLPLASRWGFWYKPIVPGWDPEDPDNYAFGWFDMEVRDLDHIGLTAAQNEWGYAMEVDIKSVASLRLFPTLPGIEVTIDLIHADGTLKQFGNWPFNTSFLDFQYNIDTKERAATPGWSLEVPTPPGMALKIIEMFAVSECYLFPEEEVGMAEFNGVDAYVSLDHNLKTVNQDFRLSADIRLHDVTTFWPVFGIEGAGGFVGMDGADTIFGAFRRPTTWTPVLDTWFNWRLEFEQVSQLNLRTFIDDVLVDESTISRQQMALNTVGVYRHGVSGTIWANMDVKNLKYFSGGPPSNDVELDMPLLANALDIGPDQNHGTTFNMDLPDV